MNAKNIKTVFLILKELVLFIKLILDEWEKLEKDGEKEETQNVE